MAEVKIKKARRKKTRSITVIGRRWFHKGPGNTYHSVDIYVNGVMVHRVDYAYGYGDQYLDTARTWLVDNKYITLDAEAYESLWRHCERKKIEYIYNVTDVSRKSDL